MERPTVEDVRVVAGQIGRPPRGVRGIVRRCSHGFPQVIHVGPIVDRRPFPTLYWLTCPYLRTEIDRLEAEGLIGRLEARLAVDGSLAARQQEAHRIYINERLALLSERDRRDLQDRGMLRGLSERGIGGIADRRRIKCLHLHVAHSMASENPIGEVVLAMLLRDECPSEQGICSALGGRSRSI